MISQLARQRDLPNMVRNGNFGSGLASWVASPGVEHSELPADSVVAASLLNSPRFQAHIPAGGYIRQVVARSDAFTYPSRRFVEFLDAIPIGIDTLDLRPTAFTTVDGVPYTTGIDPFAFEDGDGKVTMTPGIQVEVDDLHREDLSGPYRIGRPLVTGEGTAQEINSVQASPINGTIVRLATEDDFFGATYQYDSAGTTAIIEIVGRKEFSRQRDGMTITGFQPNDVIVITAPDFRVARVLQVARESDRYRLTVAAVAHAPFLAATNDEDTPQIITSQSITEWFVSPITRVSMIRELPVYQYDLTLAYSFFPATYNGVPVLDFVNRADRVQLNVPRHVLENGEFQEDLSVSESPDLATLYRRRLVRFFIETRRPVSGLLRLSIKAGQSGTDIGDVVMYRGNFTRRHDYDDRDSNVVTEGADRRSALDRLLHGVDTSAGIIPRGTVMLYTGGAQCPAGYRRLDSTPGSMIEGLETIPAPDAASYDADRNRTILVWDSQSFPLLDRNGRAIPRLGDTQDIQVSLPPQAPFNSAFETIKVGSVHQRVQPGMSLRVRMSDIDTDAARRFDYSILIRQAFVEQSEIAGPADGITYPMYMSGGQFSPGESTFTPIGPPGSLQPTTFSGTSTVIPGPANLGPVSGVIANPASFSGLTPGGQLLTMTGVQLAPLDPGDLVFIRWNSIGSVVSSGSFVGRVVSNDGSGNIAVERADGNGMIVPGSTIPLSGTASISDALVFGSDTLVVRTIIGITTVWSVRRMTSQFKITVFGDVTSDIALYNQGGLVVEPTGFIRYGKSGGSPFDYGSRGHSHKIEAGDAIANTNIAPHVNQSNEGLPPSTVAYKHGHGFLPKFVFPIPRFVSYLLCERL